MTESHPEFDVENAYLERALQAIDAALVRVEGMRGETADSLTHVDVQETMRYNARILRLVRSSPYFGRVDFRRKGRPRAVSLYIGRTAIWGETADELLVIDWRAPAASLFYSGQTAAARYHAPEGLVEGTVLLRRRYDIAEGCLRRIMDEFDQRETVAAGVRAIPVDPDEYLRQLLSSTTDGRLHDIVTTIRAEQDEVIRAPHDRILLIQGVPGSGKTSVALHRLAYLLYPGAKRGFRPERALLVGPNRVFLHYVAQVLPELDVHRIPQTTFTDWAVRRMGLRNYRLADRSVEGLLAPATARATKESLRRQSQLKGSLRMAKVVRRYVDLRREQLRAQSQGMQYRQVGPLKVTLRVEPDEIQTLHARNQEAPLNAYRKTLLTELTALLDRKYEARLRELAKAVDWQANLRTRYRPWPGPDLGPLPNRELLDLAMASAEREEVRESLERRVAEDLQRLMPPMSFPRDYYNLFRQPGVLARAAEGILTEGEMRVLATKGRSAGQRLQVDDVASLYCFYIALHGVPEPNYDHVVVDEAQDLSPLALRLLRAHVPAGSMTIIGDVGQAVYAHRGFTSWDAVREAFAGDATQYAQLSCSYRSTAEITQFANELRTRLHGQPAEPFERHGAEPVLRGAASEPEYLMAIAEAIRVLQEARCGTVAVIAKTAERCEVLYRTLREQGVRPLQLASDSATDFAGKVLIVPVYLSKGLEFDGAVVVDADASSYTESEDDARLLYVAITRPLHHLFVLWQGLPSPLLR